MIRRQCFTDEDCQYNSEKVISMLDDIGISTHLTKKDLYSSNSRDNIIFII